jgi:hypothetical protein
MRQVNKWYENKILWLILLLGLLIRVAFIFHPPQILFDAKDYDALGKSISEGKGYNIEGINNTPYIGIRSPGYPIFLGAIYYLFGYNHIAVYMIQILLDLIIILMLYLLLNRLFPDKGHRHVKHVACLVWAINLMSIYYCVSLLSEILFIFLIFLSLLLLVNKIYLEKKYSYMLLISVILGLSSMIKPFAYIFYVLILGFVLFQYIKEYNTKNAVKNYAHIQHTSHKQHHKKSASRYNVSRYSNVYEYNVYAISKFSKIILLSLFLFIVLSSAFSIRNYVLFGETVGGKMSASLAIMGGNPNIFSESDIAYLNNLTTDEYKVFTPSAAINNSQIAIDYAKSKILQNPGTYLSNSIQRGVLLWLEPFGLRSVFLIGNNGNKSAFDKTYIGSFGFVLKYGYRGYFRDLNPVQLVILLAILIAWFTFLAISIYGMFLSYDYDKFLFWTILLYCLVFSGVYALTVIGPRYFLPMFLLLTIPFSYGLLDLKEKFISSMRSRTKQATKQVNMQIQKPVNIQIQKPVKKQVEKSVKKHIVRIGDNK